MSKVKPVEVKETHTEANNTSSLPIQSFRIVAQAFAEDIKVARMPREHDVQRSLTDPKFSTRSFENNKGFFAFRFGAVTFWNLSQEEMANERRKVLSHAGLENLPAIRSEDFVVEVDPTASPRVDFSKIIVDRLTPERAEVIALTVAQSASMDYYEMLIERIWGETGQLVQMLRRRGHVPYRARDLQKTIGEVVYIRNEIIGVLHLLDRPDLIWEDKAMDSLYEDFRAVFDLSERFLAIQHKLASIQDTLEIIIESARHSRSFIVEVLILLLILFEIIMAMQTCVPHG